MELFKSRGFWQILVTLITAIGTQFPDWAPWVEVALLIVVNLATYFGVEIARAKRGQPKSYAQSQQFLEAVTELREKSGKY